MGRQPPTFCVVNMCPKPTECQTEGILREAGLGGEVGDEASLDALGFDGISVMEVVRRLERAGASPFTVELIECIRTVGDLRYYAMTKLDHG